MILAGIIIGILLIIFGITCMSAPIDTYFGAAYLLAILLFVYGIYGLVRFFRNKASNEASKGELIVSILALIIGIIYVFRPGDTPPAGNMIGLDRFVLFVIAAWFLIKGCVNVVTSWKTKLVNRKWFWSFVTGILSILLGIYSFAQPFFAAAATGTLIGLCFLQCGLDLLAVGLTAGAVQSTVQGIDERVSGAADRIRTAADNIRAGVGASAADAPEAAEAPEEPADEAKND